MKLGIDNFRYSDLRKYKRLQDLSAAFDRFAASRDGDLFARFESYRFMAQSGIAHGGVTEPEESELLISVSRHLSAFLTQLFHTDATPIKTRTERDSQVARFKKEFVSKRVAKVQAPRPDAGSLTAAAETAIRILSGAADHDPEYAFAVAANRLIDLEREYPRGGKTP